MRKHLLAACLLAVVMTTTATSQAAGKDSQIFDVRPTFTGYELVPVDSKNRVRTDLPIVYVQIGRPYNDAVECIFFTEVRPDPNVSAIFYAELYADCTRKTLLGKGSAKTADQVYQLLGKELIADAATQ